MRDIKKDEELFINYTPISSPKAVRAEALAPYGIEACQCQACLDPTSDARRARIGADLADMDLSKIEEVRKDPKELETPYWNARIRSHLEQINLIEKEGYYLSDEGAKYHHHLISLLLVWKIKWGEKKWSESSLVKEYVVKLVGTMKYCDEAREDWAEVMAQPKR